MSLSTPSNDDSESESKQDQLRDSSLAQPHDTYPRFLASLQAYYQAAYDSIQLPSSGIGYANEISALSTVFPGLYPFETLNPASFAPRSLEKAEDPPASGIGEQDAVGPERDAQSPNTPDSPNSSPQTSGANMFHKAHDIWIQGCSFVNNNITEIWNNDKSLLIVLVVIALICFSIFIFLLDASRRSPAANPSPFPDFPARGQIHYMNVLDAFARLEKHSSIGAINGSDVVQDSPSQVHPGTRKRVLTEIKAWVDNPNVTEHILWLHGPVGVRKSTIAQTITYSYTTKKVPATFFFFHSDSKRSDGNRLFTTIAWQFASSIPAIKSHVAHSLILKPDLPRKNIETQFQELVVCPLEALIDDTQLSDMVVVIDGVDECKDVHLQKRILDVIGKSVSINTRVPLRFFIISKPELHISDTINRFERHTRFIDLTKYADVERDIEKYLSSLVS